MRDHVLLACVCCLVACGSGPSPGGDDDDQPPGGGIADLYPNDVGIGDDPRVLFADDFESYASSDELDARWDARYHDVAITQAEKFGGAQAVQMNTSLPGNFGAEFTPMPNFVPELGRWYSFEVMLKANTPGSRDGRITAWIDGAMILDFPNLRLRDVPDLTIDRFGLSLHFGQNPSGETRKWYDNVVAATEYIGPVAR